MRMEISLNYKKRKEATINNMDDNKKVKRFMIFAIILEIAIIILSIVEIATLLPINTESEQQLVLPNVFIIVIFTLRLINDIRKV